MFPHLTTKTMAAKEAHSVRIDSFSKPNNSVSKKAALLAMLEQHQSNNYDLDQIGLILGGAEKILRDYLSSNDIEMNEEQLTQIEKVITSRNAIKRTPKSMDEINDSQSITYTFNSNQTFYHHLFEKKTATKIIHIVSNIWLIALNICLGSSSIIWYTILLNALSSFYHFYSIIVRLITVFHWIVLLLTMNKKIFTVLI